MTPFEDVCLIVAGCAMGMVAALNKHFYWRKGWFSGDKEAPRWAGRLLFGVLGAVFIVLGIARLLLQF